jgi:fluoride exporter
MVLVAVVGGGLIGSGIRSSIALAIEGHGDALPLATLSVNLLGSFLLGLYLARRERSVASPLSLPFWAIGMLGSFTTFSTFSLEVVRLIEVDAALTATAYVAISIVGGLFAVLLGDRLGRFGR